MSNLEYWYACREMQLLVGGRLDKLYDMENGEFRLRFRAQGRYEDVSVKLGERMHLTKYIRDAPKTPSNLAMYLRKRIEGTKLTEIRQHDFDRVVALHFIGEQAYSLIFEMFAEGNLLLTGQDGKILRCVRREEWKDRILREGHEYKFPASDRLSPPFNGKQLGEILGPKTILALLSSKTNFGNQYLEEALARAGISPKKNANELGGENVSRLVGELNGIFGQNKPLLYKKNGKAFDYSLAPFSKYSELEQQDAKTLSEAIDECANADAGEEKSDEGLKQDKRKEKLKLRLQKQEERLGEMMKEAEECKRKGDEIYARYAEIEEVLKTIREMKKQGKSWNEIKTALADRCRIEESSGTVTLDG
jgi:predicted ribosome quality control (RQC) complex YloA/Tae2 family protein